MPLHFKGLKLNFGHFKISHSLVRNVAETGQSDAELF